MGVLKLYTEAISNWLSGGANVLRENLSSLSIKPAYDRFMTRKAVTRVWIIRGFPVEFDENFSRAIRVGLYEKHPKVKTMIQYIAVPANPPATSEIFKKHYGRAEDSYNKYASAFEQLSDGDQQMGKSVNLGGGRRFSLKRKDLDRRKELYLSYQYVYAHTTSKKSGKFFRTHVFVKGSCNDVKELEDFRKTLNTMLTGMDMYFQEIRGNVSQYLSNFAPATYDHGEAKKFTTNLMSDENITAILPTISRGLVGGRGTLEGLDLLSGLPLVLNYHKTSAAQVLAYVGLSGHGKTFAGQVKLAFLAGQGHHVMVVDLKGREWIKLMYFLPVLNIDLDGPNARFVNTLRMDDLKIDPEDASYMYEMCIKATVQLLMLMVNLGPTDNVEASDVESLLEEAIRKAYDSLTGFNSKHVSTFRHTKSLTYETVLNNFAEISQGATLEEKLRTFGKTALRRMSRYLIKGHSQDYILNNELTLGEVIDAEAVTFSLNKNTDPIMTLMDDIKVFMLSHLGHKKIYVRSKQGLHTIMGYEEVQRMETDVVSDRNRGSSPQLLKNISSVISGSRSDNVMVFLFLNSVNVFKHPDLAAARSNVTTVVGGKMNPADIDDLVNLFGAYEIEGYLKEIAKGDPKLKNAFAIKFYNGEDTLHTIFKVVVPDEVELELRQRDVVDIQTTQVEEVFI